MQTENTDIKVKNAETGRYNKLRCVPSRPPMPGTSASLLTVDMLKMRKK